VGTFKIQDVMITLESHRKCDHGRSSICRCSIVGCGHSPGDPPDEEISELADEQLKELKDHLKAALDDVAKREKALHDEAKAAGKSVEAFELDALEKQLTTALEEVRKRKAKLA
jgi:hypothetical protein